MNWKTVSTSEHISLYPSLCQMGKTTHIAWYEYTSAVGPSRSDVWGSCLRPEGGFAAPVNLSGGVSYNNGPSLASLPDGRGLAGWHSWRAPGKEPFTPDGDISNLWLATLDLSGEWAEPCQALPELPNTRYAALTPGREGMSLFFIDRDSKAFRYARSVDGLQWKVQPELPEFFQGARFPDVTWAGRYYLAFCPQWLPGSVAMATSTDGLAWSKPKIILEQAGVNFRRPKISVDGLGRVWVASHTEGWGERRATCRVHHEGGQLRVGISCDGSAGNLCWTLNALTLKALSSVSKDYRRMLFSFGMATEATPSEFTDVRSGDCLYSHERGFGFDGEVQELLRELGGPLTRSFVHAEEPRLFLVDAPAGVYELEFIYSSWVASRSGTVFEVSGAEQPVARPSEQPDEVHLCCLDQGDLVLHEVLRAGANIDLNRPSKVLVSDDATVASLAATRYGPDSVDIVYGQLGLSTG